MNLGELSKNEIDKFGEHVSVIFEGREYTNVGMRKEAMRLGNALKKLGVKRGDRVIIQMPNCPEVLQCFGAVYAIGLPMKGTHMKIVDFDGLELPAGQEGEIIISGPTLMKGYWNQPDATAAVIKNGWLYTGDVGYRDQDGYYFITERKKDIIIKSGENIAPREIEEVIYKHPKVSEAAVIGINDAVHGEDIKAFVVLKPGETVDEEEMIAHCRATLKRFKSPKAVEFLDALPKSLVGKVLKKELRKRQ